MIQEEQNKNNNDNNEEPRMQIGSEKQYCCEAPAWGPWTRQRWRNRHRGRSKGAPWADDDDDDDEDEDDDAAATRKQEKAENTKPSTDILNLWHFKFFYVTNNILFIYLFIYLFISITINFYLFIYLFILQLIFQSNSIHQVYLHTWLPINKIKIMLIKKTPWE